MRELGMLDIEDEEYDEEEAKLQLEMKNALDKIDAEIEIQAKQMFEEQKKVFSTLHLFTLYIGP